MKRLLVPIDLSPGSINAMELCFYMARRMGAGVYLLNVVQSPVPAYTAYNPELGLNYNTGLVEYFEIVKRSAEKKFNEVTGYKKIKDIKVKAEFISGGSVYSTIREYSDEIKADMIVMGTKGNTGIEDIILGSNAERITRYSKLPVLVVSHRSEKKDFKKIVFASDFSEEAYKVFPQVRKFAKFFNSEILLLKVNTRDDFRPTHYNQRIINDFMKKYKLKFESIIYDDYIKEDGIINYSKSVNADLIVLGTHGKRGLSKFFAENVSGDIVNLSPLPVLTFNFKT